MAATDFNTTDITNLTRKVNKDHEETFINQDRITVTNNNMVSDSVEDTHIQNDERVTVSVDVTHIKNDDRVTVSVDDTYIHDDATNNCDSSSQLENALRYNIYNFIKPAYIYILSNPVLVESN